MLICECEEFNYDCGGIMKRDVTLDSQKHVSNEMPLLLIQWIKN